MKILKTITNVAYFFFEGVGSRETNTIEREYEDDGTCQLDALGSLVHQSHGFLPYCHHTADHSLEGHYSCGLLAKCIFINVVQFNSIQR